MLFKINIYPINLMISMKKVLLLCCCLVSAWAAFAQQQAVTGKVTDGVDGPPLPGVSILVKGTTTGTTTDVDGNFRISAGSTDVLVFSFIGFEQQEITVGTQTNITVSLIASALELGEIVVIGYGEREKRDLTGAISSVSSEDLAKSTFMNPELAMQGRMAGVFVSSAGGNPNARPVVRIRGVSTFNNAEPLYVVDGVPMMEFGAGRTGMEGDIRGGQNVLNLINPGDIESISVLKDASASAIYGSRAANGVVLITTKRGKQGKPVVEFNALRGVQNIPNRYETLNTAEYTSLYQEMLDNDYLYRTQQGPNADPANPYAWDIPSQRYFNVFNPNVADTSYYQYLGNSDTYDWQNELVNKNAVIEDYSVRVSGGSESTNYYIGTGYSRTESPLIQNFNERYSISTNVQTTISKVLEAGVLLRASYLEALDNTIGDLDLASRVSPWQPIYDPNDPTGFMRSTDVTFAPNPAFDLSLADPGPSMNIVGSTDQNRPFGAETSSNMFAQMALAKTDYSLLKNFGTLYLQAQPIEGLKLRGGLSVDYTFNRRNTWDHTVESVRFSETPENPYANQDGTSVGTLGQRNTRNINIITDLTINYNKTFRNHTFDVLLNASNQDFKYDFNGVSSPQRYANPQYQTIGGLRRFNDGQTNKDAKAIQGYVGRISYNYLDKYYLDVSVRRDGSSEFAPEYRWGTFPAVSAAWRLSSEDFLQNSGVINDLKLRAGYGILGNSFSSGIGYSGFSYLSILSFNPDYSLGSGGGDAIGVQRSGAYLRSFPNVYLTWEKAKTFNIAVDGAVLNNQVRFTIEYYNKTTDGIFQAVDLPANAGILASVPYNVAVVKNAGIELELGYNREIGDLILGVSGNITTVRNRVVELYEGIPRYDIGLVEGEPANFLYGYDVGGIFQSDAEIAAHPTEDANGANPQPGDMWFKDLYGSPADDQQFKNFAPDGTVDTYDRTNIGKTIPGFYYGLNISAQMKGFDLSVFFQGIGDVQKYNWARAAGESMSGRGLNYWTTTKDRWTPDNPSASMPRAIYNDPNGNNRYSSRFVEDAGFMRLKNVQIGYSLPSSILETFRVVSNFRIYATATNLFTVTQWTGLDPENDEIPPTRVIQLGLSASF